MTSLISLTDFGDLAVVLPLAAALLVWLAYRSPRDLAPIWLLAVLLCIGVMAGLKIVFFACPPAPDLVSPSGHTSLSALVYGALALVAASRARRWQALLVAGAGVLFILAIAASRVALDAHTLAETVLGLAVGVAALAVFAWNYLARPPPAAPLWQLLLPVALLLMLLHGDQLRAEEFLRAIGTYLHRHALSCG